MGRDDLGPPTNIYAISSIMRLLKWRGNAFFSLTAMRATASEAMPLATSWHTALHNKYPPFLLDRQQPVFFIKENGVDSLGGYRPPVIES